MSCPDCPGVGIVLILPAIAAAGLLLSSSCSQEKSSPVLPSEEYRAFLTIERGPEGYGVWVVNVTGHEDAVLLAEAMPGHPASLMAYLAWDDADRLWWYGSDDGSVFFWERSGTGWTRYTYSPADSGGLVPPESLFTRGNRTRSER